MPEERSWKAVWISTIDNYDDLDDYAEDTWDENGERLRSPFAKDFGIDWYDPDAREFDLEENASTFEELFNGVSNENAFLDRLLGDLRNYDPLRYKSFLIISDYRHESNKSSDRAVFVGNYKYR